MLTFFRQNFSLLIVHQPSPRSYELLHIKKKQKKKTELQAKYIYMYNKIEKIENMRNIERKNFKE